MKQFFKMFFASLLAMIVAGVIIFGIIIGLIISAVSSATDPKPKVTVSSNSVLYMDLKDRFHEQGEENPFAILADQSTYRPGLYDVVKSIEHAADDEKISGIVLRLNPSPNGWATLQQLRDAMQKFKESGKFIYAYGERINQNSYYVATVADSVFLNPVGDMELKGFATVLAFFKGTLDKLEVKPEIYYAGKFKSATEPFRLKQMSEENEKQIAEFQQDFWSEFTKAVSQKTGLDTAGVTKLATEGTIQFPQDALDYKLIDGLWYSDQVEDLIRAKTGTDADKKVKLVNVKEYADNVKRNSKKGGDRIAVLYAEGSIIDGESNDVYQIASKDMVATIRGLREDDDIRAVVMRVNSPGGSALASEVILRELQLLKKEKPLVVSMGDVAASGGYYISSQADSIFVMPNTITGSIGVFTVMFNIQDMMNNKLGITFDGVKNAPHADFPSGIRPSTPEEQERMQASVDNIYTIFKSRVADGRKMSMEYVDSLAQGRIWTGTDAVKNGLADGFGNLNRAVASAASLAGLDDYSIITYPEPVDKLGNMLKQMNDMEDVSVAVKKNVENSLTEEFSFLKQVKQLKDMNGKGMMLMPYNIDIK